MSKRRMSPGVWVLAGYLVVNGVICLGGTPLGIHWYLHPPGRVQVRILCLREEVEFASCVAECNGVLKNMDWSPDEWLEPPSAMHPKDLFWSNPRGIRGRFDPYVVWKCGRRYGVVTKNTETQWQVTWFEPDALQRSSWLWYLSGRGLVTFDMSKGQTESLSDCQVEGLGLDGVE
jgi:hypothetical protein